MLIILILFNLLFSAPVYVYSVGKGSETKLQLEVESLPKLLEISVNINKNSFSKIDRTVYSVGTIKNSKNQIQVGLDCVIKIYNLENQIVFETKVKSDPSGYCKLDTQNLNSEILDSESKFFISEIGKYKIATDIYYGDLVVTTGFLNYEIISDNPLLVEVSKANAKTDLGISNFPVKIKNQGDKVIKNGKINLKINPQEAKFLCKNQISEKYEIRCLSETEIEINLSNLEIGEEINLEIDVDIQSENFKNIEIFTETNTGSGVKKYQNTYIIEIENQTKYNKIVTDNLIKNISFWHIGVLIIIITGIYLWIKTLLKKKDEGNKKFHQT
jgi:hypothetical protein